MICPNCKKPIPDDSVFCEACGTRIGQVPNAGQAAPGAGQAAGTASRQQPGDGMPNAGAQPQFGAGMPGAGPQPSFGRMPQAPVKKKSVLPVILIIAAVIIIAAMVVGGIFAYTKMKAGNTPRLTEAEIDSILDEVMGETAIEDETEAEESGGGFDEAGPEEIEPEEIDSEDIENGNEEVDIEFDENDWGDRNTEEDQEDDQDGGSGEDVSVQSSTGNWFKDQGLTFSDPGNISFETTVYDSTAKKTIGDYTAKGEGSTLETVTDKKGYKNVVFYFELDCSDLELDETQGPDFWVTAFDRTTGICFEAGNSCPEKDEEGFVNIKDDIKVAFNSEYKINGDLVTVRITTTVPDDYTGTTFLLGYYDDELSKEVRQLSESKLYRIDEMPCFNSNGHEYLYYAYKVE